MEDEEGEEDGGERLDGGDNAGFGGEDVGHASQIEDEGADGTEEDHIGEGKEHRHIHRTGEGGEGCHGDEEEGGQEHTPAHHQRRAVFPDDFYRRHGVEGAGQGGEEAPEEGFFGNGQAPEAAAGGNEGGAGYGKDGAENFPPSGPPPFGQAVPEDDEDGHEVFQNGGGRGVAGADGGEIAVLGAQHAEDTEDEEGVPVLFVLPDGADISMQETGEKEQKKSGGKEPEKGEPLRGYILIDEKKLACNAAAAPEDGTQGGGEDAFLSVCCHRYVLS